MFKAIINVKIFDYDNFIEDGYIVFDDIVREVGPMSQFKNNFYHVIHGHGQIVMPSFVCAHSHIYSIFARGLSLPFNPKNFQDILDQMWWKLDDKIDNDITYYSGIAAGSEFLLNGVTTIIDHHASGEEIVGSLSSLQKALVNKLHMRGLFCFESSDRYNIKDCIKENSSFASKHVGGLFGMHASMSLSDNSLKEIAKKQGDTPIHIHVAESKMDVDDCLMNYQTTIVERLDKYHLIKPDSLLVHCTFTTAKEIEIIKERKAYVVINPSSNLNNAVGITDIRSIIDSGVKVMIGNDGLSSSMTTEYLNAYYLGHLKNSSPLGVSLDDIKNCIVNAYEYVSRRLGVKIGKLQNGYVADFLTVDYVPFTEMNYKNAFGHIFFGLFPNFKPRNVYVNGKQLVKNYELTSSSVKKELEKSKEYSKELWKRVTD